MSVRRSTQRLIELDTMLRGGAREGEANGGVFVVLFCMPPRTLFPPVRDCTYVAEVEGQGVAVRLFVAENDWKV